MHVEAKARCVRAAFGACAHVRASGERQQRWGERQSIGGATVVEDLDEP